MTEQLNKAGLYIANAPIWWNPETNPEQVKIKTGYLLTILGPEAYKARPQNGLLLYGPPGTGKTSAGLGVLYEWGKAGHEATFADWSEVMVKIRSAWRKDAQQTTEQILDRLLRPKILMLDDIAKRATPEDQETIGTIVNGRINRGRPTIATTNCDLQDRSPGGGLEQFLNACDSRVLERYSNLDISVKGDNLRRKK